MMVVIFVVHKLHQLNSSMRAMNAFTIRVPISQMVTMKQTLAKPLLPVLPCQSEWRLTPFRKYIILYFVNMINHVNKIEYDILPKGCQSPFTLTRQHRKKGFCQCLLHGHHL